MFTAIVLALSFPQLETKFDYAPEAARLEVIAQDLGPRLKMKVGFSKELQNEVLVIAVKGVTGKDLIDKIAGSMNATAHYSANEVVISQTDAQKKSSSQAEFSNRRERLASSVKTFVDAAKIDVPFDDARAKELAQNVTANWKSRDGASMNWYRAASENESKSPVYRFACRIVRDLPVDQIAGVANSGRTVFAIPNNKMQVPLKVDITRHVDQLYSEQKAYAAAITATGASQPEQYSMMTSDVTTPFVKPPTKVIVVVEQKSFQGTFVLVHVLDEEGLLASVNLNLEREATNALLAPSKEPGVTIELDPLSKEWGALLMQRSSGAPTKASTAVVDRLQQMDKLDPLGLGMTSMARTILEKKGQNVVANVGDEAIMMLLLSTMRGLNSLLSAERVLRYAKHDIQTDGGWYVIKQREPNANRATRFDRKSLAEFVRYAVKAGEIRLGDLAKMVCRQPEGVEMEMLSFLVLSPLDGLVRQQSQLNDPWLRFFGTLDERPLQSQKIEVGTLSKPQLQALNRVVYNGRGGWGSSGPPRESGTRPQRNFMNEPTEIAPNGLTNDMIVNLQVLESEVAVREKGGSGGGESAEELAWALFQAERHDLFSQWNPTPADPNPKFRIGRRASYDFRISVGKTADGTSYSRGGTLNDFSGMAGPFLALDKLPEAFRQKTNSQLENLRKQYKDAKPGDFGGQQRKVPPPLSQ